jgi:hypothetical protein
MNASTNPHSVRRGKFLAGFLIAGLLLGGLTACRTTRQVEMSEQDFSGFLGDYSQLRRGEKGEANFIYFAPGVRWGNYTKICIRPVELWKSATLDSPLGQLSPQNQQMLVNYFHAALVDSLGDDFQIVNYAGPDVLVIHAAVTDARPSRPVLNLVSTVVPMALIVSYGKQTITGTGTGVGMVMVEAEFTDGQTGQRLAAVVDARAGTKALRTKFTSTWGDVKLAFDWWAQRLDERLIKLKAGSVNHDSL